MSVQTMPARAATRPLVDIAPEIRNEFELILSRPIGGNAAARMTEIMHLAERAVGPETAEHIRKLRIKLSKCPKTEEGALKLELGMMIATHPLTNAVCVIAKGPC